MRKLATFISVLAFAAAVSLSSIGSARAGEGNTGFGRLQEPNGPGSWLVNHYDNRAGQVTSGPAFDDSAEVKFVGTVVDIGEVTVEQSAAWTWTTSGAVGAGPCALVYDSTRTLVRIHTHQGVSTENVSGPLTRIPGSAVNDPGGRTEFPFAANGTGANGLIVGAQIFPQLSRSRK